MNPQPLIDDRNYVVTAINGYRSKHMKRDEAEQHARRLNEQMRTNGWTGRAWTGRARIVYRDGSEVPYGD